MKNIFIAVVCLLVGLGLGLAIPHGANQPQGLVGGSGGVQLDRHFTYGLYAGQTDQFSVTSTGTIVSTASVSAATYQTATIGSSSSSPAALGSATAGHFVVAAGQTQANASTTAVTANSSIALTVEQTTPIAGTTCNTTIPTSTPAVLYVTPGNGFGVKLVNSPITNPLCLSYRIVN